MTHTQINITLSHNTILLWSYLVWVNIKPKWSQTVTVTGCNNVSNPYEHLNIVDKYYGVMISVSLHNTIVSPILLTAYTSLMHLKPQPVLHMYLICALIYVGNTATKAIYYVTIITGLWTQYYLHTFSTQCCLIEYNFGNTIIIITIMSWLIVYDGNCTRLHTVACEYCTDKRTYT